MYPDPKRVRSNRYTIRLDDYEDGLVQAMANYQGEQLATLLRERRRVRAVNPYDAELDAEGAQCCHLDGISQIGDRETTEPV